MKGLDDSTYCNVRILNYKRSEHQIKYLSSFVAFKCFGYSVFALAASQSAAPVRAWDYGCHLQPASPLLQCVHGTMAVFGVLFEMCCSFDNVFIFAIKYT